MKKEYSKDDFCFKLGLVVPIIVVMFYLAISKISWMKDLCIVRKNTEFYCPGCGGSRGVQAFFSGEILKCIYYYPAYLYAIVYYIIYMGSNALRLITKGKVKSVRYKNIHLYILLAIVLVNWIVKNIMKMNGIDVL